MWNRLTYGSRRFGLTVAMLALAFAALARIHAVENESASVAGQEESDPRLDAARIANSTAKPQPLRILVIGAHPADVFDQSGGTMAHHVKRGDWVGCVVVTTGTRVHDKVIADEMQRRKEIPKEDELKKTMAQRAGVKEKEVIHACSILGVREQDIHFLGIDDMALLVNEPTIRRLARRRHRLKW